MDTNEHLEVMSSSVEDAISLSDSMKTLDMRESRLRWFYRDSQDKKWVAFNGYDSLRLEAKYRIWRSTHPKIPLTSFWPGGTEHTTTEGSICEEARESPSPSSDLMNVSVLGGLYEADICHGVCAPIYWTGGSRLMQILRGVWFRENTGNLEPLDDNVVVDQLESQFLKLRSPSGVSMQDLSTSTFGDPQNSSLGRYSSEKKRNLHSTTSAPVLYTVNDVDSEEVSRHYDSVNKQSLPHTEPSTGDTKKRIPIHTARFADCHVDWYASDEIYMYQESTSLYIRQKLGMQKIGSRLCRGFDQDAEPNDRPPDVTHLCFVVHGIGQKMGTNPILKCCNDFRDMCNRLKYKYFPGLDAANQRVEFLPVEWRSSLQLDGDTVESITPICIRGLRNTLNSSVMDIMYYNSPIYRAEISASLLSELNRLYHMFCSRNPRFESRGGKVSVLAHSLGCVLAYDLITGWSRPLLCRDDQSLVSGASKFQPNGAELTLPKEEITASREISKHISTDRDGPTGLHPSGALKLMSSSSQRLQHLALVSSQLESARILVSRLEQELSDLLNNEDPTAPINHAVRDKRAKWEASTDACYTMDEAKTINTGSSYFTNNSLLFKNNLTNLFCLGSPLSVFLALRGIRPGSYTNQDSILPRRLCPRIFNIYHPADPVAYRLEPLILKHYSSIQPALIHRADAINKPDYDHIDLIASSGKEVKRHGLPEFYRSEIDDTCLQSPSSPIKDDQGELPTKQTSRQRSPSVQHASFASRFFGFFRGSSEMVPIASAVRNETLEANGESEPNNGHSSTFRENMNASLQLLTGDVSDELDDSNSTETSVVNANDQLLSNPDSAPNSLQLVHRIDFQLRASRYENMYLSFITSHTSYWTNADVGMLIMTQLFGAIHPPK